MASWSQLGLSCVAGNPSDVGRNRSAAVVDARRARPLVGGMPTIATLPEMTTAFVTKALTFDQDKSGTLNATEARTLATAFIRTLG